MKTKILSSGLLVVLALNTSAVLVDSFYDTVSGGVISDANPTGITFSHTTTTDNLNTISGVTVRLDISGGFNGDLYGYLVFQATDNTIATTTILLDRVGRTGASDYGFSTSGMTVVLTSSGLAGSIHDVSAPASTYGNASTYYLADTRTTSPTGDFTGTTPVGSSLSVFDAYSHNANGTWTLFLSDLSGGDVSTLVHWGLDISVVPEPTTWALILFAVGFAMVATIRRLQVSRTM